MFLNGWKRKNIKRNIEELVKKNSSSAHKSGISLVGILVDYESFDALEDFKKMVIDLGKGINYNVLCFVNNVKEHDTLHQNKFDPKGISFKGEIKDADLSEFLAKPFDLLISYYQTEDLILQYISAKSTANFKVGFPSENYQINDLIIDVPFKNTEAFTVEMIKYLKILNRID